MEMLLWIICILIKINVHGSLTLHETEPLDLGCTYFTCGVTLPTGWLSVVNVDISITMTIMYIMAMA